MKEEKEKEKIIVKKTPIKKTPVKEVKKKVVYKKITKIPTNITAPSKLKPGQYTINEPVTIAKGGILVIAPGTVITFEEASIRCLGKIIAKGTIASGIQFHGPDGWDNITIMGKGAEGIFEYCIFKNGFGMEINITMDNKCKLVKGSPLVMGGALLFANDCKGSLKNSMIEKNYGKGAVCVIAVKEMEIIGNTFKNNDEEGLHVVNSTIHIKNNKVLKNNGSGMVFQKFAKGVVRKNIIRNNKNAGISAISGTDILFEENTIEGNKMGFGIVGNTKGTVRKNIIKNNSGIGLGCDGKASPTIENNEFEGNLSSIYIRGANKPIIKNNRIKRNQGSAIALIGPTQAIVKDNIIDSCKYAFLVTTNAKPVFGKNTITNCSKEKQIIDPKKIRRQ